MAAALVPEVKVIADDDGDEEAPCYLDPSLGSTGRGRGPLLAPPPRFHPEDEEDDPGWLDLTDGTAFLECPDLLHSYTSLRPRLSYRCVCVCVCVSRSIQVLSPACIVLSSYYIFLTHLFLISHILLVRINSVSNTFQTLIFLLLNTEMYPGVSLA